LGPPPHELFNRAGLDLCREPIVGGPACAAFARVGNPGTRADQDESLDPRREARIQGCVQGNPPALRVAGQCESFRRNLDKIA
jgi:hypothetical protein